MNDDLLICTNGRDSTWPAIEYGAWVAAALHAPVTLLGIAEHLPSAPIDTKYPLEDIFARAVQVFEQADVHYSLTVENGDAERVIPRVAGKRNSIVVLGRLGRPPLRRFLSGRSIRHLLAEVPSPILYVPRSCLPVKKMLICMGGLGYEVSAEQLAIRIGLKSESEITLLHVTPPVDLDYPSARAESQHWRELEKTDTVTGRHVRKALEAARGAGLNANIKARQGEIAEEILTEIRDGGYDLVCMGSPYSGHGLRHLYGPNVTDEVAERTACPLLTVRYGGPQPQAPV